MKPIDALVVGLDNEFNYRKLCIAVNVLHRNPGALFVATNQDSYDLVGLESRRLPGNGAIVKAIEHSSRKQSINVGKPSRELADLIGKEHSLKMSRTMMVGDRLDTDIRFGANNNMISALVLTGCTSVEEVIAIAEGQSEEKMPSVIFPYMGMMG
eukprot:CAMPEP_0118720128 /NCGR_PEP_ID=MMETSP0800-20121206/29923_1 /TAXON_ID=210618 ORGANISM="Striatella unipunctata, Strain CCMP2910" /NCGR_SAMPLE_ID=MMETSP0800 /ASSEMBLY_ACC=CAM_ASM_000638 /LENGTH=154 /DNA_ID=CAMNT_0006627703 /DNA_START=371 /DNA_END=835 /DNA_ORIENTATION=-